MAVILWAILALGAGGLVLGLGARRLLVRRPALDLLPGEELGSTMLERAARVSLIIGLMLAAVAAGLVAWAGPQSFYQRDSLRLGVTMILLAALVVASGFAIRAKAWSRRPDGPLDERDQTILERAPALEGMAMLVTLAVWVVGLQERFLGAGAVPMVYLYLIFWSMLMVKALALPIGVLIAYRRS